MKYNQGGFEKVLLWKGGVSHELGTKLCFPEPVRGCSMPCTSTDLHSSGDPGRRGSTILVLPAEPELAQGLCWSSSFVFILYHAGLSPSEAKQNKKTPKEADSLSFSLPVINNPEADGAVGGCPGAVPAPPQLCFRSSSQTSTQKSSKSSEKPALAPSAGSPRQAASSPWGQKCAFVALPLLGKV